VLVRALGEIKLVNADIMAVRALLPTSDDFYRHIRKFGFGLQEYVEAVSFYHYLLEGRLVSLKQAEDMMHLLPDQPEAPTARMELTMDDYLLGVTDLSGELMRFAANSVSLYGNTAAASSILYFMQSLLSSFRQLAVDSKSGGGRGDSANPLHELAPKITVMEQSLSKVELLCYKVELRRLEFPDVPLKYALMHMQSEGGGGGGGGSGGNERQEDDDPSSSDAN